MAVIQDLPLELIIRILELTVGSLITVSQQAATRSTLAQASLVARSWRALSQQYLASTFTVSSHDRVWMRYLEAISNASASPSTLRCLLLVVRHASAEKLALLQQQQVELRELSIISHDLELNASHTRLLGGLRRLKLLRALKIPVSLKPATPTMLESLFITSDLPELPSFFLPVSTFAPRLTHLEINTSFRALGTALQRMLQPVAPQLTRLGLTFTLVRSASPERRDTILSSLHSFLLACTSIKALRLHDPRPNELRHLLSLLPSRLILLDVSPLLLDHAEGMPRGAAEAFDLPCMAQLRRWRMTTECLLDDPDSAWEPLAEEQWRAACRARGIEPRGEKRYFTD
ncbi:hypothetical protein BCR35DRAFT_305865 [Leucosporidium creatinivorum]|uniref:F-box domain-containing protein n=1 Tax=Leucosporidium creatinivorum TaxID=106004 RepID=A0A1Y2EX93_9BASI|nr:hypothetical protein BCR35DRAFT_305865 [Leucosporidium creatinivorum]